MKQTDFYKFTAEKDDLDSRLDVFLHKKTDSASREKIKQAILHGQAKVDGKVASPGLRLKTGQTIEFTFAAEEKGLEPSEIQLNKIFENDDFLVVDKPAGLVVHPGAGVKGGTLANALIAQYPELGNVGQVLRPGIVHRLDKETSGLLLIAKNEKSYEYAKDIFKKREVVKEYLSLVCGEISKKHGLITDPLKLAPHKRKVVVSPEGRDAKTEYRVLNYYADHKSTSEDQGSSVDPVRGLPNLNGVDYYTFVRVILHTGRTHQIRVHFANLSHSVAGDETYGKNCSKPQNLERQFLHAARLMFKLPDGTTLDLESPLPQDLQEVLDKLILIN